MRDWGLESLSGVPIPNPQSLCTSIPSASFSHAVDLHDPLDFSAVADGLEPIVIERPGSSATTLVPHALRRRMNEHEAEASHGRYTACDIQWQLPRNECPTAPRPGDVIVAAGDCRFTVLEVLHADPLERLAVRRPKPGLHARPGRRGHHRGGGLRQGAGGAVAIAWQTWRTGVRARIQPGEVTLEMSATSAAR